MTRRGGHREGTRVGVLRGYGYWQPEREGYRAGLPNRLRGPTHGAVGFFFANVELSLELWTVIAGILGFDD